ncbi:MAG TPA: hypothetical protein VN229_02375 [Terriglobales bacterium]|nr:hypothetical protein [Terriglobales bacterium]
MVEQQVTRLSPAEALQRWGSALMMKMPDGTTAYASFDDGDAGRFWYPVLDEDQKLISYVLMAYPPSGSKL